MIGLPPYQPRVGHVGPHYSAAPYGGPTVPVSHNSGPAMAPFEPEVRGPSRTMPEVPPPQYTEATYGDDGYPGFALPTGQSPARTSILRGGVKIQVAAPATVCSRLQKVAVLLFQFRPI